MNHYFFFDKGDFFSHFIDGCDDGEDKNILEKFTTEVKEEKMALLLDMAIRSSSAQSDPFKDDVNCVFEKYGMSEQLLVTCLTRGALGSDAFSSNNTAPMNSIVTGSAPILNINSGARNMKVYESFTLDYKVKWPLSLIISKRAINKYQLIFRHLLQCKYVCKDLENMWQQHQSTKECEVQSALIKTFALRHRMLQFIKNYIYYMQIEVLEPNFHKFKLALKQVKTFDDIIHLHSNYLD
jgi:gamma-tubulin complex component 2